MKTLDVVYVLGTGSSWDNNEIRFSIRSVLKNLPGIGRIIIIGEKSSGLKGFVYIAHPDEFPSINARQIRSGSTIKSCPMRFGCSRRMSPSQLMWKKKPPKNYPGNG